ncbi:MAG: type IX secretion system sortase PorU, partial [Chitinophagaceae bacterium]
MVHGNLFSQKKYVDFSVLSQGEWYKIAVSQRGIYKIDAAFFLKMGIKVPIQSSVIRLFGNGGRMLAEDNASPRLDDLKEVSISVNDGGDGSFGVSDYILFFAPGSEEWTWNIAEQRFIHTRNLYSDSSFYFLSLGGEGKRIQSQAFEPDVTVNVSEYDALFYHELDSINLLYSGKQWFGEEFGSANGQLKSKKWTLPFQRIVKGEDLLWNTEVIARSSVQPSLFNLSVNGNTIQQLTVSPLNGIAYEPIANQARKMIRYKMDRPDASLEISFSPGSINAQGWLDKIEVQCRHELLYSGNGQLHFRDRKSLGASNAVFNISDSRPGQMVWDVTNTSEPIAKQIVLDGNVSRFTSSTDILREFVSSDPERYLLPSFSGKLENQNLHGIANADFIIVTVPMFMEQVTILAKHHQQMEGLSYVIVNLQHIFNEFSSGQQDPVAIRDFLKMLYDRASGKTNLRPKFLLFYGVGSVDPKNRIKGNINHVPTYQSDYSLDPLTTYTSDDFFGFLDDYENISSGVIINKLDIGIGRIPARDVVEGKNYLDKILSYSTSFGTWRNQITVVADDEDQNIHLLDAEEISEEVEKGNAVLNIGKIYLDAFVQMNNISGAKYPAVNDAINRRMYSGNLIWNYSGHGGYARLAQESILEQEMVNSWMNESKLPMFITASCDFAPFDNPLLNSLGGSILMRPKTGAIALLTTTRLVFAASNKVMNSNFMMETVRRKANGDYPTLGEVMLRSKNQTYEISPDILNNRKFTLLGDPALVIGYPKGIIKTVSINGVPVAEFRDTLKALNKYVFSGLLFNSDSSINNEFNGYIYITIYDKRKKQETNANDAESLKVAFDNQQNVIFNGKGEVSNGNFSIEVVIPKDIDLKIGKGKVSYYASNKLEDAAGFDTSIYVGGFGNTLINDGQGPGVKAYLNDELFVNGGLTNEKPVLIIKVKDSSGLNTTGLGVGHDITAILDGNFSNAFILNDFFEPESGKSAGTIRFPLPKMENGYHKLVIKVWDIFNNSTEYLLEFQVANAEELKIEHVLNYPNPFTTKTSFWF